MFLFYDDPCRRSFDARLLDRRTDGESIQIRLDQTAFYPEGGGQPCDRGRIGEAKVLDVQKEGDLSEDGEALIWHTVDRDPFAAGSADAALPCEIDWSHRFDYMQQHTGQHILSAAFLRVAGLETVSVHQGEEYTTIEFDAQSLPAGQELEIERLANRVITERRRVRTYWCGEDEIPSLNLRRPPKVRGSIRIVEIEDFDCVACGGVHTSETSEVSLVRVLSRERIRGRLRYSFLIGERAHAHHRSCRDIVASLGDTLSVPATRLPDRVDALLEQSKQLEYELGEAKRRHAVDRAQLLVDAAEPVRDAGSLRAVHLLDSGSDPGELRSVAEALAEHEALLFILGMHTEKGLVWIVGHGSGVNINLKDLKAKAFPAIDAKGGGKPPIYQGKGSASGDWDAFVRAVLEQAQEAPANGS